MVGMNIAGISVFLIAFFSFSGKSDFEMHGTQPVDKKYTKNMFPTTTFIFKCRFNYTEIDYALINNET